MSTRWTLIVMTVVLLILVSGCGQAKPEPRTTPVALAATEVPPATTRLPRTATPIPVPTDTAVATTQLLGTDTPSPATPDSMLPTASPTVTEAPSPPHLASLGEAWTRPADGMRMIYVPGGEFPMGSDDDEVDAALAMCQAHYSTPCQRSWFEVEQPVHTVALYGFWLDRTEVTNAQYRQCVEAGACTPPRRSDSDTRDAYYGDSAYDDYPVVHIAWSQADAYCRWADGRLPTEAEWEYAARGSEGRRYPWGEVYDGLLLNSCDVNCGYDWAEEVFDDGYGDTAPSGSYPSGASWCGALDLAGNVWEWMADWFGEYPAKRQSNPTGPSSGTGRALRGDAADGTRAVSRAVARHGMDPDRTYAYTGFRCAVSVPASDLTGMISPDTAPQVEELYTLGAHNQGVAGLVFLPDGAHLVSLSGDFTLKVWDTQNGREASTPIEQGKRVYNVAFSEDGTLLAVSNPDHTIGLWTVESGQAVRTLDGHGVFVMKVAFAPDGALLASADTDGTIKLWDVGSGEVVHTLQASNSPVGSLAFSPDGTLLASGNVEGSSLIKLWDVESGQEVQTLSGHSGNVYNLLFAPDGKELFSASGDLTIRIWGVKEGQTVRTLRGHRGYVYGLCLSPDGSVLASSSAAGEVILWDVENGQSLHTLRGHQEYVFHMACSPDGSLLASGGAEGQVMLWGIPR